MDASPSRLGTQWALVGAGGLWQGMGSPIFGIALGDLRDLWGHMEVTSQDMVYMVCMILTYFDHIKRLRHSMRHHEYPWMVWMCGGHIRWTKPSSKMGWSSHGIWDLPMQQRLMKSHFWVWSESPYLLGQYPRIGGQIAILVTSNRTNIALFQAIPSPFWLLQILGNHDSVFVAVSPFSVGECPFFCWQTFSNFRPAFHSLPPKRAVGL